MADAQAISWADLRAIENNLNAIHRNLDVLNSDLGTVNDNVATVYKELGALAEEFHDFVSVQVRANRLGPAATRLVKIRISNATEEMMISTPGYWLAPCLVALAAWINDQPELADKALREAIKRNDEKTSLFWALVCRRANRKQASLKWTQRYLENQDEANLNRNTVIILDAYASGLLGADSEGVISRQMDEWLDHLEDQPGFVDQQTKQWSEAIKETNTYYGNDGKVYEASTSYDHVYQGNKDQDSFFGTSGTSEDPGVDYDELKRTNGNY